MGLVLSCCMICCTLVKMFMILIYIQMRSLLAVRFQCNHWVKSCNITSSWYVFISAKLLLWAFGSGLWVNLSIRSARRMVIDIARAIDILQLGIRSHLFNRMRIIWVSWTAILKLQHIWITLLVYNDAAAIVIFT